MIGDNVKVGSFSVIRVTGVYSNLGLGFTIWNNSNPGKFCFDGASVRIGINERSWLRINIEKT